MLQLETSLRHHICQLASSYGVGNLRVFGSYARGDATENSDLDLLFDAPAEVSLFAILDLREKIEDLTKVKVDLVEASALTPRLREHIMREASAL